MPFKHNTSRRHHIKDRLPLNSGSMHQRHPGEVHTSRARLDPGRADRPRALLEDLGQAGDLTSDALIPSDLTAGLTLTTRQPGVVAGWTSQRSPSDSSTPRSK
jgi:hypothetical protein